MNIKSVKKQLNKVNALFSVMENEDAISAIEKDLFKSYVQKLYEQIIDFDTINKSIKKVKEVKVKKDPLPIANTIQASLKHEIPNAKENVQYKSDTSFVNDFLSDPIEEVSVTHHKTESNSLPQTTSNGVAVATNTFVAPELNGKNSNTSVMDLVESDEKIKNLFTESKSSELSDKLRNRPIQDINSALGLNERILMINELFGRSSDLFKESINSLNELATFAEAKKYLVVNLIKPHQWTKENKVHIAASFIKLVRRRYI
jgi:hypothetical protein